MNAQLEELLRDAAFKDGEDVRGFLLKHGWMPIADAEREKWKAQFDMFDTFTRHLRGENTIISKEMAALIDEHDAAMRGMK